MQPFEVIKQISSKTDSVILFHSGTGKDSIALLDMLRPHFKEIVCVYMYVVPDLEHINKYINYSQQRYGVKFLQVPHYALSSMIKAGHLGIKKNEKQKLVTLAHTTESVQIKTGIEYCFFGFKQSDSMNRRLMLRTYEGNAISPTKKIYPLSEWKNKDVLAYIKQNNLLSPINYGGKTQSSGCDVEDINFLLWCKNHFPNDYKKIINVFPLADIKVFEYENKNRAI
jgi:sulfate adenylyltransferase subunit 2